MGLPSTMRRLCKALPYRPFGNPTKLPMADALDLQDIKGRRLPLDDFLLKEMQQKGPMSFNKFMEHCLLHSTEGYYMKRDVFNAKGDFVTSPEISQMFGEMVALWIATFLDKTQRLADLQQPTPERKLRLLEIGPGRGTLMSDVLRTMGGMGLLNGLQLNFIEFSPVLRQIQQESVQKTLQQYDYWLEYQLDNPRQSWQTSQISDDRAQGPRVESFVSADKKKYMECHWYKTYEEFLGCTMEEQKRESDSQTFSERGMASTPVMVVAHELFDALPVHIFRYNGSNWQEQMVDQEVRGEHKYRWVNGPEYADSVTKILNPQKQFQEDTPLEEGDKIEVSPQAAVLVHSLAELIRKDDGAVLVVDYGEDHAFSDSVRAIRRHKYLSKEDLLDYPGEADLSVYVNFEQLRSVSESVPGIKAWPTLTQGHFLEAMGITTRLQMLQQGKDVATRNTLEQEYQRLTHKDHMGAIYKFMYIGNENNGPIFPFQADQEDDQMIYQ